MKLRASALILLAFIAITSACAGSDGGGGESLGADGQAPIGAPDTGPTGATASVEKSASVAMDVPPKDLKAAAQDVVDLATGDSVGGFLVSSVVDTQSGYGMADVSVKVPSPAFEPVVAGLEEVGHISRQELHGEDLSDDYLAVNARLRRSNARTAALLRRIEAADDPGRRFRLRAALQKTRSQRAQLEQNEAYIEAVTSYSTINVAIAGEQPPPPPPEPPVQRALETAANILVATGTGAILAAGVLVPLTLIGAVGYLLGRPLARKLRSGAWPNGRGPAEGTLHN